MCKCTDLVCRLERLGSTLVNEEMYEKVTIIYDVEVDSSQSLPAFVIPRIINP